MLEPEFGLTEDDSRDRCHVFGLAEPLECHHGNLAVEAYAKTDKNPGANLSSLGGVVVHSVEQSRTSNG
jgi:hypothetical protein